MAFKVVVGYGRADNYISMLGLDRSQGTPMKCKCKSYSHFFSKNISIYGIFNNQSFNKMLINDIPNFEQLGPDGGLFSYSKQLSKATFF